MGGLRLWLDDVRPAPAGWLWARTFEDALEILRTGMVQECSLDHDLGFHDVEIPDDPEGLAEVLILRGTAEKTGYDFVCQMLEEGLCPPVVHIHSWNPDGARYMAARLGRYAPVGTTVNVQPFKEKREES